MATQRQKSDHITRVRMGVTELVKAYQDLTALQQEFAALDLATELTPEDFVGENEGLTPQDILDVYATITEITEPVNEQNTRNLFRVKI